jgi:alpha-amylase
MISSCQVLVLLSSVNQIKLYWVLTWTSKIFLLKENWAAPLGQLFICPDDNARTLGYTAFMKAKIFLSPLIMSCLLFLSCPGTGPVGDIGTVPNDDGIPAQPIRAEQNPSDTFEHPYFGNIRSIDPDPGYSTKNTADWHKTAVFYHIWVNAFRDSDSDGIGDLPGITEKIQAGYFSDLGVTALWLSPIFATAGQSNPQGNMHGYDTTDHYAVNPYFGDIADLRALLDAAHNPVVPADRLQVIFDFVPNHVSSGHPWFTNSVANTNGYGDWFRWIDEQPPGWNGFDKYSDWHYNGTRNQYYYGVFWDGMPDLNYRNPEVQKAMADVLIYWLNFGFDGIRVDAVKYVFEDEPRSKGTNFWDNHTDTLEYFTQVRDILDRFGDADYHKMMVAENWTEDSDLLKAYGFHAGETSFHMTLDFYSATKIENAVDKDEPADTVGDEGAYQFWVENKFDGFIDFGPFLSNHDKLVDRPTQTYNSSAKSRLAASYLLFSPGAPFLYYGNEIGMLGDISNDINLRQDLPWDEVASQQGDTNSILEWYKAVGAARAEFSTTFADPKKIRHTVAGEDYAAVLWVDGSTKLLAVFNHSDSTNSVTLDLSEHGVVSGGVRHIIGDLDGVFTDVANFQINNIPLYGTRLYALETISTENYIGDNSTDVSYYVPPPTDSLFIRGNDIPGASWASGLLFQVGDTDYWYQDLTLLSGNYEFKFTHAQTDGWSDQYNFNSLEYNSDEGIDVSFREGDSENILVTISSSGSYRFHVNTDGSTDYFWVTQIDP